MKFGVSKGLTKREAIEEILRRQQMGRLAENHPDYRRTSSAPASPSGVHDRSPDAFADEAYAAPLEARQNPNPYYWGGRPPSLPRTTSMKPDYGQWSPGEDPKLTLIGNPANRGIILQHEREIGPWPRTPEGRPYDVGHIKAIADGGTNTLENIRPVHPDAHRAEHMANGDFSRWAKRQWIARAFGGRVARGFGPLSVIPDLLGILTGRIRTDNYDNFTSDLMGLQSQEDFWREQEEIRQRTAPNAPPGTIFF